ncbi:MerR family transcriptional regulator [Blastomonas sp. AAP53]|uniref:MerR family transcriptional regulator n=1 Tax=Blastomonas sp. AAP53 TaxID=1248760 RepID=UPI00037B22F3
MTIGKLAQAGGVGVETVRYYQRRGLLAEPERAGGVRRYGSEELSRLRFIRSAQAAGFTLEEIRELLELDATRDRKRALALANTRIAALDRQLAALQRARQALARLASACESTSSKPCPIITAFEPPGRASSDTEPDECDDHRVD